MFNKSAIVIGAGIAGLATARALAIRNYRVTVIERTLAAVGASVRNFGLILPAAQPDGQLYERAKKSAAIWKQICDEAGIWYEQKGSLHLAYAPDEWQVLTEVRDIYAKRGYTLMSVEETISLSPAINKSGLVGALYSKEEMIVDPRKAIVAIPQWLTEKYGVRFIWGRHVSAIAHPVVYMGAEKLEADEIFLCSGADFESLYPEIYRDLPLTKCKLQMMRLGIQPNGWRLGPALCSPLSLLHYNSYKAAGSFSQLKARVEVQNKECLQYGIHLLVSQNEVGELAVGDSHAYGLNPDPFDRHFINELILQYLGSFAHFSNSRVVETWNGVYPKLTNGETDIVISPQQGVTIINGFGGAGMTLAFGRCEEVVSSNF